MSGHPWAVMSSGIKNEYFRLQYGKNWSWHVLGNNFKMSATQMTKSLEYQFLFAKGKVFEIFSGVHGPFWVCYSRFLYKEPRIFIKAVWSVQTLSYHGWDISKLIKGKILFKYGILIPSMQIKQQLSKKSREAKKRREWIPLNKDEERGYKDGRPRNYGGSSRDQADHQDVIMIESLETVDMKIVAKGIVYFELFRVFHSC